MSPSQAPEGVLEFEQGRVASLDDHGRRWHLRKPLHLEGQGSVRKGRCEVLEGLSLDRGDRVALGHHRVVAGRKRSPFGRNTLAGEPVRVALAGIDRDLKATGTARARGILAPGFAALAAFWVC
jgi:hypothetical protein